MQKGAWHLAMATAKDLTEDDLATLHEALYGIRKKCVEFGLQIGVNKSDIENIEAQDSNLGRQLLEILTLRVKQSPALTWANIDKALRSCSVGEALLADKLQQSHSSRSNQDNLDEPNSGNVGRELIPTTDEDKKEKEQTSCENIAQIIPTQSTIHTSKSSEKSKKGTTNPTHKRYTLETDTHLEKQQQEAIGECLPQYESTKSPHTTKYKETPNAKRKRLWDPQSRKSVLDSEAQTGSQEVAGPSEISSTATRKEEYNMTVRGEKRQRESPLTHSFSSTSSEISGKQSDEKRKTRRRKRRKRKHRKKAKKESNSSSYESDTFSESDVVRKRSHTSEYPSISSVETSSPQPHVSHVLKKYKKYLQSWYKARPLAQADKFLPTLKVPYINLAMVSKEECSPEQRDEFTRQTLHGGVDQILKNKTPVSIDDLLTPEKTDKPVRFILVEGPPGIGKSTFAWEVCRRWDELESFKGYHAVVLLKLREKWVLNATSLPELFRYQIKPGLSQCISEKLDEMGGQNLMLVLDGFDEVSHSFHDNSVVKSILRRELLQDCTIILTTRPSAKVELQKICEPQIDKHIEIIGFTEDNRKKYITEIQIFRENPVLRDNFMKYIVSLPHIKSMMYIPLNCAIIAKVYHESYVRHQDFVLRTRTDLYRALTNSILVRHMQTKECMNCENFPLLPEGLTNENMENFKALVKFAFNSYHEQKKRKVVFFNEDIPEGLVHFGFMNESTEMYASKGVERTLSFLHLSLQEYLAAWHLADSYSIEFQVAYHKLALDVFEDSHKDDSKESASNVHEDSPILLYKGDSKEEKDRILSLQPLCKSLQQPALFLAGITGWRCQSEDHRNRWEIYIRHDTVGSRNQWLLSCSLYEAQNPTIIPHCFATEAPRRKVYIKDVFTPYFCYAVSYCLAHSLNSFDLLFEMTGNSILLVEPFFKGLCDHCQSTTPVVKQLEVRLWKSTEDDMSWCLRWLMETMCLTELEKMKLHSKVSSNDLFQEFLKPLDKLQSLFVNISSPTSWEWLEILETSLSKLQVLHIFSSDECSHSLKSFTSWPKQLKEIVLNINFPCSTMYELCSSTDVWLQSVLRSSLRSKVVTKMSLPNISRETMSDVRRMLLHCPSLTTLELKRTRLGYDGILYICSALKKNITLTHLTIHDDPQIPPSKLKQDPKHVHYCFTSFKRILLPEKITCTDFLLELNNILKKNSTLKVIKIQSGLFVPLPVREYFEFGLIQLSLDECKQHSEWTEFGPLQQFKVGAINSGIHPSLKRSFSLSDLTHLQTHLFWERYFPILTPDKVKFNFQHVFLIRGKEGKELFSLPSFTAPDTAILPSFSGLDDRLQECLQVSHLEHYIQDLKQSYDGLLGSILKCIEEYVTESQKFRRMMRGYSSDSNFDEYPYSDSSDETIDSDEDLDEEI